MELGGFVRPGDGVEQWKRKEMPPKYNLAHAAFAAQELTNQKSTLAASRSAPRVINGKSGIAMQTASNSEYSLAATKWTCRPPTSKKLFQSASLPTRLSSLTLRRQKP
jgi:hypothetical protein